MASAHYPFSGTPGWNDPDFSLPNLSPSSCSLAVDRDKSIAPRAINLCDPTRVSVLHDSQAICLFFFSQLTPHDCVSSLRGSVISPPHIADVIKTTSIVSPDRPILSICVIGDRWQVPFHSTGSPQGLLSVTANKQAF